MRSNNLIRMFMGIIVALSVFFIAEAAIRLSGYSPAIKKGRYMIFNSDKGFFITDGVIPKDHFLFARDPYLFWRLSIDPPDEFDAVNPQGFRGEQVSLKKPPHTYRIFCIGDSCTFGLGLRHYQAYPCRLEGLLNQPSQAMRYEVVNAGVPGYSSLQGLRHLKRDILKYKPDMLIVSFGWNDSNDAVSFIDREQKMPDDFLIAVDSFMRHFKVYQLLDDIISRPLMRQKARGIQRLNPEASLVRVLEEDFIANLTDMHKLAKAHGFKIIFLSQPSRRSIAHHYAVLTKEFSVKNNLMYLDVQKELILTTANPQQLFIDDNHPSAEGHNIIAKIICSFMKEKGVIK